MNIEAIQKAYAVLKKEGITKNPRNAFTEWKGTQRYILVSSRVVALVNILQQELCFPPFYTCGITYIEWVSESTQAPVTHHKDFYFLNGSLKKGLPRFKELLATARCFI